MEGQGPVKSRQPALCIGANSHDLKKSADEKCTSPDKGFFIAKKDIEKI
jgi:hypothetical protein